MWRIAIVVASAAFWLRHGAGAFCTVSAGSTKPLPVKRIRRVLNWFLGEFGASRTARPLAFGHHLRYQSGTLGRHDGLNFRNMMMRLLWILVSIVMVASVERNALAQQPGPAPRLALIVGNSNYPDTEASLKEPLRDAVK